MSTRRIRVRLRDRRARRQLHRRTLAITNVSTAPQDKPSDDLQQALDCCNWNPWTISRPCAVALYQHCLETKAKTIVDFGSGASTIALAHYARETGAQLVSYESDPRFHAITAKVLASAQLADFVDLRLAPLVDLYARGFSGLGYETGSLPQEIDFVFVDGPSVASGRRLTLPSIIDHLSTRWTAAVHDACRQGERNIIEAWKADLGRPFTLRLSTVEDSRGVAWLCGDPDVASEALAP